MCSRAACAELVKEAAPCTRISLGARTHNARLHPGLELLLLLFFFIYNRVKDFSVYLYVCVCVYANADKSVS